MAEFEFGVFLSYAHDAATRPFARTLTSWLQAASFTVWLDEEQVPAGEDPELFIPDAAKRCRHAILILSEESLQRDWTRYEQKLFAQRRQQEENCRLVPVLRLRGKADLGPHLGHLTTVSWPENEQDTDARFWEVLCGLRGQAPGPISEWASKGRAARSSAAPARADDGSARDRVLDRLYLRADSQVLHCDRYPQWSRLGVLASTAESEAIFVPGGRGHGHEYFRLRVLTGYPAALPFTIEEVAWKRRPFPKTRGEFLAALAQALRCAERDLVAAMRERLADRNLVLLHAVVADGFADRQPLVQYYCEYLPELLREVKPKKGIKCIQPVEWVPRSTLPLLRRVLHALWPRGPWGSRLVAQEREARELLAEVRKCEGSNPRIVVLDELQMITLDHVRHFLEDVNVPTGERERLAEMIMAGTRTAEEVIDNLAKYVPERKEP